MHRVSIHGRLQFFRHWLWQPILSRTLTPLQEHQAKEKKLKRMQKECNKLARWLACCCLHLS